MDKQQEEWKERVNVILVQLTDEMDYQDTPEQLTAFTKAEEDIYSLLFQARKEAKIEMLTDVEQSFQNGREEALEEIKSTEKDVAAEEEKEQENCCCASYKRGVTPCMCGCHKRFDAEEENQKLPSELIEELSQQDFGCRIGIGTIMRAMDHLAKKNNWKI